MPLPVRRLLPIVAASALLSGCTGDTTDTEDPGTDVAVDALYATGMFALNDTRIDYGADASSTGPCGLSLLGEDGSSLSQDCEQGRSGLGNTDADGIGSFNFTRLLADGSAYTGSGNFAVDPWSCVRDNRTGLVWEVKTTDGGMHDARHTYRWGGSSALGRTHAERQGDYYDDWNQLLLESNTSTFCGYSDWRVPTSEHLLSIADFGATAFEGKIDDAFFPHNDGAYYWSSEPTAADPHYAWTVQYTLGNNKKISRYHTASVRMVRVMDAEAATSHEAIEDERLDTRYEVLDDGTVLDRATQLIWAQCVVGQDGPDCEGQANAMDWGGALAAASDSELAGHTDWRLPNITELYSIASLHRDGVALNTTIFPTVTPSEESDREALHTWSSSPSQDFRQDSWYVDFATGMNWFSGRSDTKIVRLVRAGMDPSALAEPDVQDHEGIVVDDGLGTVAEGEPIDRHLLALIQDHELTGDPTVGRDLPRITDTKAQLGRALFYSKRLSGQQDVACASCHHPALGGGDGLSWPVGIGASDVSLNPSPDLLGVGRHYAGDGYPAVGRNAPSLFNLGLFDVGLFWDSRVESLDGTEGARGTEGDITTPDARSTTEPDLNLPVGVTLANAQSRFPMVSHYEMRGGAESQLTDTQAYREAVAARFVGHDAWEDMFEAAYGDRRIDIDRIAESLGTYEESMVFIDNPWKAYVEALGGTGNQEDLTGISEKQKAGAVHFLVLTEDGGGGCTECHVGDTFTDGKVHALGIADLGPGVGHDFGPVQNADTGRYAVSGDRGDAYHFRTTLLHNVEVTGPYMHNGSARTLEEVMEIYGNPGGAIGDLLGIPSILDANAVFNSRGNAGYCSLEQVVALQDMGQATTGTRPSCEDVFDDLNPDGVNNSRFSFFRSFNDANSTVNNNDLAPDQQADVVEFMRALTDPCVKDRACLDPWVVDQDDIDAGWHPDSAQPDKVLIGVDADGRPL